ncbi:MAG TPA: SDR family NAD(P)-dependent oxidoreductase [Thermoanaerobaculia bacterium]|nr:SDR family NAD(P)-dependent oxidoreductase [Thermoanaerobaculia bacterium]
MKQLRGRVAVVTGAGAGIGRALAHELAVHGCMLELADVDEHGLGETAERVATSREPGRATRAESNAEFDRVARTSPEAAARKIVRGVRRNARRVLIGNDARLLDLVQRCFPSGYQRLLVAMARRRPNLV